MIAYDASMCSEMYSVAPQQFQSSISANSNPSGLAIAIEDLW